MKCKLERGESEPGKFEVCTWGFLASLLTRSKTYVRRATKRNDGRFSLFETAPGAPKHLLTLPPTGPTSWQESQRDRTKTHYHVVSSFLPSSRGCPYQKRAICNNNKTSASRQEIMHDHSSPLSEIPGQRPLRTSGSGGRTMPNVVLSLKNTAVPGASATVRPSPPSSMSHCKRPPACAARNTRRFSRECRTKSSGGRAACTDT